MIITQYTSLDHSTFESLKEYLSEDEIRNNYILGKLSKIHRFDVSETLVIEIDDPIHRTKLVILKMPDNQLILTGTGTNLDPSIKEAIRVLLNKEIEIESVRGVLPFVCKFNDIWCATMKCSAELLFNQGIYAISKLNNRNLKYGTLREMKAEDKELAKEWIQNFYKSANHISLTPVKIENTVMELLKNRSLYVWEDHIPVAMVGIVRRLANTAVLSYVYTPNQYQNQGYATTCVYALTQKVLDIGYEKCCLHADLDNPISNAVYKKIGFELIDRQCIYKYKYSRPVNLLTGRRH